MRRRGTYEPSGKSHAPPLARLMRRVNTTGPCWLWTGSLNNMGYGTLGVDLGGGRRTVYAHRLSYELQVGPIPDGLLVLHSCDVPNCVNPAHLHLGTQSDNIAEMWSRGRRSRTGRRRVA